MKITPDRKSFGRRLRKLRTDKVMSQESLATKAGLHRTYIGAVERGEQSISIDNMQKLARALKIKLADLVKGL